MIRNIFEKRIKELIVFIVLFVVYNMMVFVIPFKKTDIFAIVYVFALISIIAFAVSYFFAFDTAKTLKSKFLSFPIFQVGSIYVVTQLSLSTVFMILTSFITIYRWIAIAPCVLILAAAIIKTMTIEVARDKMENIAIKQKINTSFIRSLQVGLEALSERVSDEMLKLKLADLSEAVKYSDPVSNNALSEIESKMETIFSQIKAAIYAGQDDVESQIDELNNLLTERNKMCINSKPM